MRWYFIVSIPENLIAKFGTNKCPIVKAVFNDKIELHISVKSRVNERYILVNGSILKRIELKIAKLINIHLAKEESTYEMSMP
ncbi:MAG: hypothetical protein ACJASM_001992 [Salibacteraceae bacterium]